MTDVVEKIELMNSSLEDSLVKDIEVWRKKMSGKLDNFNAFTNLSSVRFTQKLVEEDVAALLPTPSGKVLIARTVLLSMSGVFIFYDAFIQKDNTILLVPIPQDKKDLIPEERHDVFSAEVDVIVVNGGVLNLTNFITGKETNIHTPETFIKLAYEQAKLRESQSTESLLKAMCAQMQLDKPRFN